MFADISVLCFVISNLLIPKAVGKCSGSKAAGNIAKNLDTNNIPNMTKQEIIDDIPDNWKYTEHNGFVHIKDESGKIRIRIDPPDKVTQYPHVHVYDNDGNLLDRTLATTKAGFNETDNSVANYFNTFWERTDEK